MNIYEKLNAARLMFQNANVKKSGKNSFSGYTYYELSDILPVINKAAKEIGFSCIVRFGKEEAALEFVDIEKPENKIVFTSPMSNASLKGCHEVQNLGAVETYIRRYLYQVAFEIVESDALDMTMNPQEKGARPAQKSTERPAQNAQKPVQNPQSPAYTQEEADQIKRLLDLHYPGESVKIFTDGEIDAWRKMFAREGAQATIAALKKEASERTQVRRNGV